MPEEEQNKVSPLLQSSQDLNLKNPDADKQNKRTLVIGLVLIVAMIMLVGSAFYTLRTGTSTSSTSSLSPSSSPSSSAATASDQKVDQDINQASSSLSGVDTEINNIDSGLNDKETDLTY